MTGGLATGVLAYDLGGSSLRVAVVSRQGDIEKMVRLPLEISRSTEGEFEVDPAIWWQAFQEACGQLQQQGADLGRVEAIAGCGFTRTQVPIDAQGHVVHPAITFQDSRGAGALERFLGRVSPEVSRRLPNLNPYHPIARMLWLQAEKPDVWAKVKMVIEPKDYLNLQLTGQACSDRISQNMLAEFFAALEGDRDTLDALAIAPALCPEKRSPFSQVGVVREGLPEALAMLAGKPVLCGSTDTWGCVLGSGGLNPGAGYGISGTSDVFGVITETQFKSDGLISVQWGPRQWQLGGPTQGAASRLQWAADRFCKGQSIEDMIEWAFESDRTPPLFLPYLDGERTPFWDADLRGAFVGLDGAHEPRDFVRAVAEGINFLARIILERAESAAGRPVDHLCLSGGLANNTILCQLKADILGRPIFVPQASESGLIGAASLACSDSGQISEITQRIMAKGIWYTPDAALQDIYDERFEIFKEAGDALESISHRISRSKAPLSRSLNGKNQ